MQFPISVDKKKYNRYYPSTLLLKLSVTLKFINFNVLSFSHFLSRLHLPSPHHFWWLFFFFEHQSYALLHFFFLFSPLNHMQLCMTTESMIIECKDLTFQKVFQSDKVYRPRNKYLDLVRLPWLWSVLQEFALVCITWTHTAEKSHKNFHFTMILISYFHVTCRPVAWQGETEIIPHKDQCIPSCKIDFQGLW